VARPSKLRAIRRFRSRPTNHHLRGLPDWPMSGRSPGRVTLARVNPRARPPTRPVRPPPRTKISGLDRRSNCSRGVSHRPLWVTRTGSFGCERRHPMGCPGSSYPSGRRVFFAGWVNADGAIHRTLPAPRPGDLSPPRPVTRDIGALSCIDGSGNGRKGLLKQLSLFHVRPKLCVNSRLPPGGAKGACFVPASTLDVWKHATTCVNSSLNCPSRSVAPCFHRVVSSRTGPSRSRDRAAWRDDNGEVGADLAKTDQRPETDRRIDNVGHLTPGAGIESPTRRGSDQTAAEALQEAETEVGTA
jgi:hypothetical protein